MWKQEISQKKIVNLGFWILLSILFVIINHGFSFFYQGNQTTKFLFGLASGGMGNLSRDWFANTQDPLPLFSSLVQFTYQYLDESLFQIYLIVILGILIYSLIQISNYYFQIYRSKLFFLSFLGIYLFSFSNFFKYNIKTFLFDGVAGQDLALRLLLPNIFGSLFFLSLALFLNKKYVWSILTLCLAAYFHSGYLIIGAVLTASYMVIDYLETKNLKRAILIGILALILVAPIVINTFAPNSTATIEQVQEMNRIIVEERIPHHTQIQEWWDSKTIFKIVLCLFAMLIMRKTNIFPLLLIAFTTTFLPVLILTIRPSNAISILQIWRVSIFLIPLSSTLIIGALYSFLYSKFENTFKKYKILIYVLVAVLVGNAVRIGISIDINEYNTYKNLPEHQLYDHIIQNNQKDDLYLIPHNDPRLYSFRLETGMPILVNWKSHPWNALEFLEWYKRVQVSESFEVALDDEACQLLSPIVNEYNITHVLTYSDRDLTCSNLVIDYQDDQYILYHYQLKN
jgi:hypothetical protein